MTAPEFTRVANVPQMWEYHTAKVKMGKVMGVSTDPIQFELNTRGREGWELVSVAQGAALAGSSSSVIALIFKRPVVATSNPA